MFIIQHKKFFLILSVIFMIVAIGAIAVFHLPLGIDFTGGSILEVAYEKNTPPIEDVKNTFFQIGRDASVQKTNKGYMIRTKELSDADHEMIISALSGAAGQEVLEERFSSIGPTIGAELKNRALIAITTVIFAIILFVAFAFRNVTKAMKAAGREGVGAWTFGLVAIIALVHDILIPTGVFAVIGADINTLFVMALLAILGFSVNDTIVVFDRIRENIIKDREEHGGKSFSDIVGASVSETYTRSINTSLTTLFVLLTLYILGGSATAHFALVLSIGVIAGTYSSVFFASPILVFLQERKNKEL